MEWETIKPNGGGIQIPLFKDSVSGLLASIIYLADRQKADFFRFPTGKSHKNYFEKTLKKSFFSIFGVDYRRSAIYIVDCSKKIEKVWDKAV